MKNLLKRFIEPSSLAGLAMLAGMFGVNPGTASAIVDALTALIVAGTAPSAATVITAASAVLAVGAIVVKEKASSNDGA